MRESDQELNSLRRLMEVSIESAGPFMRESLQMPEHSLRVEQLLKYWDGMLTAAVATTSAAGEPRVAPTGVGLLRGNFLVPTVAEAARTKAVRARPAISISRFDEGELAVIVHGSVKIVGPADPLFADLTAFHREIRNGEDVTRWKGSGVYLLVKPSMLYTFARYPEQFPG